MLKKTQGPFSGSEFLYSYIFNNEGNITGFDWKKKKIQRKYYLYIRMNQMFMKELATEIRIAATRETIWQKLTDFTSYPMWNPFITHIEGECALGSKIAITLRVQDGKMMRFTPAITMFTPQHELRWKGTCLFTHKERFSGLLIPLFKTMIDTQTRIGFERMNLALKQVCEAG
jgi:hypothetical protein